MTDKDEIFSNEEIEILEEHLQYSSYKRCIEKDGEYIVREMAYDKPDNISSQKLHNHVRNQVNYQLQRDEYMLKTGKYNMQGYRNEH